MKGKYFVDTGCEVALISMGGISEGPGLGVDEESKWDSHLGRAWRVGGECGRK